MRIGLAAYVAAMMAVGSANADFDPTRASRRGLLIDNKYILSTMTTADKCAALKELVQTKKAELMNLGALRQEPANKINALEFCAVSFSAPSDIAEAIKTSIEAEGEYTGLDLEQDTVVEPLAVSSWGLDRIDQANLPLNDDYTSTYTGQGVTVFIVDTGVNAAHVDFGGRATQAIDYTGEGNADRNGHGSHCAGTVGGTSYGVAKNAKLVGVKVLGSNSGVMQGVQYAIDQSNGASNVISMSLGGGASTALDNMVKTAANAGMIVVVAAGNENQNACNVSPARAGGNALSGSVITVGSTTITDTMSSFSNYGACTDVFAPGSQITSAWIGSTTATRTISGTSMATPHVAGVAALLLEKHNGNKQAAQAELFQLVAPNKVTNIGPQSPNKLLQIPKAADTPNPPPAPTPTPEPTAAGGGGDGGGDNGNQQWTCPQSWFDANDGCDCGCGAPMDPDCYKSTTTELFCRGRGARWWQVCLESTNECVSRYGLLDLEEGQTLPPTFADEPRTKEGVENGVEYPPPLNNDVDPVTPVDSGDFSMALIGSIVGVCAVAGMVALVVVQRRRKQNAAPAPSNDLGFNTAYVAQNPQYRTPQI